METLVDRLSAANVRLSAQRRVLAECLDGQDRHVTADSLLREAREQLPEIGRATVYKALGAFVAADAVREVQLGDGPTMYDPNAHVPHDHLVCDLCNSVWDTAPQPVQPSPRPDFQVWRTDVTHYGVCRTCTAAHA